MRYERVLVTGGSGRLGRHVVDVLKSDYDVTVLDLQTPTQQVAYRDVDILNPEGIRSAVRGQDAIIHLAGYDDGDAPDETGYIKTNVQGAWHVFHAAEEAGVRHIVTASSTATYGIGKDRTPDFLPVSEDHPLRPRRAYDVSKQMIEDMARHFARRERMTMVCLRPTLIVRPEKEAEILAQLSLSNPDADPPKRALSRPGVTYYGALGPIRTYVRSRDAARAFRAALEYQPPHYDVINIAADDTIGRTKSLRKLDKLWGTLPKLRDPDYFDGKPLRGILDNRRARDRLHWWPESDWRDVGQ